MFLVSSPKPIDPQLQDFVQQIEKQSPAGISVLAGRQFRYPLKQILVEVTISEPRKFNILEEFILRAGMESELIPTENELAAVWRRLLIAASRSPEFYAQRLWTILLNPKVLIDPDTQEVAGDCIKAFAPHLSNEALQQIESVILGIS